MSDLDELQSRIIDFRNARDWKQFHNPKDVAISLALEAAEVLEHFQWKTPDEIESHLKTQKSELAGELIDVLYWVLLLANDLDIDIKESFDKKMDENNKKYSVKKSKSSHKKYSEL